MKKSWVHIELVELPADYELEVQDKNHDEVDFSNNSGPFPELLDLYLEPGDYFVLVSSGGGQATNDAPYRLNLSSVPADGKQRPASTVLMADTFTGGGRYFAESLEDRTDFEVGYYDGEYVVFLHKAVV